MKKKLVTNLLDNICTCRDLVTSGNTKEIIGKIYVFDVTTNEIKRQINKFIDDKEHELDFTAQDLYELSDEIHEFLNSFDNMFSFKSLNERINKHKVIDDNVINEETNVVSEFMYIDRKLRECYKLLSYLALVLSLWIKSKGV